MEEKIQQIVTWLDDKKGEDIVALDVRGISPLTEAMVFVTARSARHAQSLADEIVQKCAELKWGFLGVEGMQQGQWVLVDCNDFIVHVFQGETRHEYNVEGLFSKAPKFEVSLSAAEGQ